MGRIEKTVFLSYRRADQGWGFAIFQNLTQHGYDVFIDYDGIASGDFETAILENIRARAHFLVLLTPRALERCSDPQDWMRREIEAAMDSQRNIVPVMLEGFDFGTPAIASQLIGKLAAFKKYNGLDIPKARFFSSEMERLRNKFLNVSVDAVLHSASDSAQLAATEQKRKAAQALVDRTREEEPAKHWRATLLEHDNNGFLILFGRADEQHRVKCTASSGWAAAAIPFFPPRIELDGSLLKRVWFWEGTRHSIRFHVSDYSNKCKCELQFVHVSGLLLYDIKFIVDNKLLLSSP
jgi:hypothetical protein